MGPVFGVGVFLHSNGRANLVGCINCRDQIDDGTHISKMQEKEIEDASQDDRHGDRICESARESEDRRYKRERGGVIFSLDKAT